VLAWVGSSGGGLSQAPQVDGVLARRQAGSTLKPFLYGLALEERRLTAASLLDDSPLNLATASGLYMPQNYDQQYKGAVSLRTALASSLNIPAVRTLVMVTPERLFQRLQALGVKLPESGDFYGYSLALGSADISLLALTNAYRALAAGGRSQPVRAVLNAPAVPPTQVMDGNVAWIIGDILSDGSARARTFGLDSPLSTRFWSAVKTGTSKDMRDNWCIGYSARYTVGVWVGNASGESMWNVSGVTGAAPVWQDVMHYLHAGARDPLRPRRGGCAHRVFPARHGTGADRRRRAGCASACDSLSDAGHGGGARSGHSARAPAHPAHGPGRDAAALAARRQAAASFLWPS
jgi:penicillin-binding protein 1C